MIFGHLKKRSDIMAEEQTTKGKTSKEIAEETKKKFAKKTDQEKLEEIKNAKKPNQRYGMLVAYQDLAKSTNKKTKRKYKNFVSRLYQNCMDTKNFLLAKMVVERFRRYNYFSKSQARKAITGYQKQNPTDKKYPKNCRIKA